MPGSAHEARDLPGAGLGLRQPWSSSVSSWSGRRAAHAGGAKCGETGLGSPGAPNPERALPGFEPFERCCWRRATSRRRCRRWRSRLTGATRMASRSCCVWARSDRCTASRCPRRRSRHCSARAAAADQGHGPGADPAWLCAFGLKVGDVSRGKLPARIRGLVAGHARRAAGRRTPTGPAARHRRAPLDARCSRDSLPRPPSAR